MSEKQPEALRLAQLIQDGCPMDEAELVDELLRLHAANVYTSDLCNQVIDDVKSLQAENAELRKDAERLDWISENPIHDIGISHDLRWFIFNGVVFKDFREAIDSARSRS